MFFSSDGICGRFYLLLMNFDKLFRSIIKTKHSQVEEKCEREETFRNPPSSSRQNTWNPLKTFPFFYSSVLNLWFNPNMSFKVWYQYSYYSSHYLIFLNVKMKLFSCFFHVRTKNYKEMWHNVFLQFCLCQVMFY